MKTVQLYFVVLLLASSQLFAQGYSSLDFTWANGNNRQRNFPLTFKNSENETILTGVALIDTYYNYNFTNPVDNTQTISSTIGRANEFTVNLMSVGFESNYKNIIGKLSIQAGNMLNIVQDADATVNRGRNTNVNNVKFIREASAGYHFDLLHGLNVEMGIFFSYIGLESYLTQENWSYQRSMVCDFTPFYFSGARFQLFPTENMKTELWLVNGWQSYNVWNTGIGLGSSTYYRPNEDLQFAANFYGGNDSRQAVNRYHHDHSVVARVMKEPESNGLSQVAFSLNNHFGFESGEGKAYNTHFMTGSSFATRLWFNKNTIGLTLRADYVTNPGLHLAFTPSPVTPNDFTDAIANDPLQRISIGQATVTLDYMPNDFATFRLEYGYREANHPYFAGHGGTTSPDGWSTTPIPADWRPDLQKSEHRLTGAINIRL